MLTDDDLTRELGGAFRAETDELRYAGRVPTPRTGPGLAVPLATTAVAAAVLGAVWAATPADAPTPPPAAVPTTGPTGGPAPRLVTDTIEVAGYSFTYRHAVGDELADDLYGVMNPGAVPDDATPIAAPEGAQAWVGTDPASGDTALWVEAPTRNEGNLFALMSPTWTEAQLTDLFHNGRPQTVPAITR